jgi:peptide deformylase
LTIAFAAGSRHGGDDVRSTGHRLAATQVDVHLRVIVIDVSETRDQLLVLINPEVVESDGSQVCEEGCLSVPGIYDKVERAENVSCAISIWTARTERSTRMACWRSACSTRWITWTARCFVEHLSQLKQMRIKAKLAKQADHGMKLIFAGTPEFARRP